MTSEILRFKKDWQKKQSLRKGDDNDSFVYVHIRGDNNQPFNVGMGHTPSRPWDCVNGRNKWHKSIVNKHGLSVQILIDGVTWEEAQFWESRWIKALSNEGYELVNLNEGGGGNKGHKASEETRKKRSLALIGRPSPMRGKKHTPESKYLMSINNGMKKPGAKEKQLANIPRGESHYTKTDEARNNLRLKNTGKRYSEEVNKKKGRTGPKEFTPEGYANICAPHSNETKAKIKAAVGLKMAWYNSCVMHQNYWGA